MSSDIARGERARQILDDPLVKEALEQIKNQTRDLFFELPASASDKREELHVMDRMRQHFESYFKALILGAEVARHEVLAQDHMKARLEAIQQQVRSR